MMKGKILKLFIIGLLAFPKLSVIAQDSKSMEYIVDMVHHNPGEPLYDSKYSRPDELKGMGYNAKCFYLFDSPTLAINWDGFDKRILPEGTPEREWVDKKAARLHGMYNECKRQGIDVYAMSDLILLPKNLISLYHIEESFGVPLDTLTQRILKYQLQQIFRQFPQMAGIIVRIGETYLEDAPYHKGSIKDKTDPDKCIIPLINLLREEVCEKLDKKIIFRTWWSFDTDMEKYIYVTNHIKPHRNLTIGIKHCEGDFHRGNPFSEVIGQGQHQQIIEVQCAREYEGKGTFPNYVSRGVIDGFEEHSARGKEGKVWSLRQAYENGNMAGLWTWTRGGGWEGPYPTNELWCDMNAWILAQWACHPLESEASLFDRYCRERLSLDEENAKRFREIALLSERAVIRGMRSAQYPDEVFSMWVRDEYITFPKLPDDIEKAKIIIAEKDSAVKDWERISLLANQMVMSNSIDEEWVKVSCEYGRQMFRIFRAVFHLAGIRQLQLTDNKDIYIKEYDDAWAILHKLSQEHPSSCPSLFSRKIVRRTNPTPADDIISEMR